MKSFILLLTLSFSLFGSNTEPSMKELQEIVDKMKAQYNMIDGYEKTNQNFDLNKQYTEQEIKEKLDQISKILKENNKLQGK